MGTEEGYRQASRQVWDQMAAGWDRRRDWMWNASRAVGEWMVDALAPRPGETILELAAGLGDTGFAASAALGRAGRLISTDFSGEMVEAARRHAAELGIVNSEHRTMDAERIDLEDGTVEGRPLSLGLHADGGSREGAARDPARAAGRRPSRDVGLGRPRPQPVGLAAGQDHRGPRRRGARRPRGARESAMAGERRTRSLLEGAGLEVRSELVGALEPYRTGDGLHDPGLALNALACA